MKYCNLLYMGEPFGFDEYLQLKKRFTSIFPRDTHYITLLEEGNYGLLLSFLSDYIEVQRMFLAALNQQQGKVAKAKARRKRQSIQRRETLIADLRTFLTLQTSQPPH